MDGCNPLATPMDMNAKLYKELLSEDDKGKATMARTPYRHPIGGGSLMYLLTATRPNLAAAVQEISKYINNFGPTHWNRKANRQTSAVN